MEACANQREVQSPRTGDLVIEFDRPWSCLACLAQARLRQQLPIEALKLLCASLPIEVLDREAAAFPAHSVGECGVDKECSHALSNLGRIAALHEDRIDAVLQAKPDICFCKNYRTTHREEFRNFRRQPVIIERVGAARLDKKVRQLENFDKPIPMHET